MAEYFSDINKCYNETFLVKKIYFSVYFRSKHMLEKIINEKALDNKKVMSSTSSA